MTSQDRPDTAMWSPASDLDDPTSVDANDPTAYDAIDAGADDPDAEVEVIVAQIEETRGDLSQTIDEIGRRLEPGNVAREAGQTVKTAATRKVDDMTTGIQDTWTDVRRGDASGIVDTIKSNPIPAAMVALGIGMLFMNRGSQSSSRPMRWESSNRGYNGYAGYGGSQRWNDEPSTMDRAGSRVSSTVDDVGSRVSSAVDDAGASAQRVADQAGRRFEDVADTVSSTASQAGTQAQQAVQQGTSQARRLFDENPLAVGVVAVAAGAAIGMLAPSTEAERRALGPTRDKLVDQAQQTANQAIDQIDQKAQEATSQAAQGSQGSQSSGSSGSSGHTGSRRSSSSRSKSGSSSSSTVGSVSTAGGAQD